MTMSNKPCWASGWNMPGYLPDVEPMEGTWEDARAALVEALLQAADDWFEDDFEQSELYEQAAGKLCDAPADEPAHVTIGNYVWWIERVEP